MPTALASAITVPLHNPQVGRVHSDHAHGVLRHLMSEIQDCSEEQELLDRALSLLKLSEPRALLAALGTFAKNEARRTSDDSPVAASPGGAQRGAAGGGSVPARRVERASVRGGSAGVIQDIQRILQISAGRLSFAHLLFDSLSGSEDWTADSEVTEGCVRVVTFLSPLGSSSDWEQPTPRRMAHLSLAPPPPPPPLPRRGLQAFADWSLAATAVYERRGPAARAQRPPRAVTMPLTGGAPIAPIGFLMVLIDDSLGDADDLAMVRQFRDSVGMCLQSLRSRRSSAREAAEREQLKMQRRFLVRRRKKERGRRCPGGCVGGCLRLAAHALLC